ncbi:Fc.00g005510.m01.CDS01 [Cosmosporella sp. VM-42]
MDTSGQQDSPLSISANIAGILTFVVAIAATIYARLTYLRNSDNEYFRVKTSLSWYKTESTWLADLVTAINAQHESFHSYQPEYQISRNRDQGGNGGGGLALDVGSRKLARWKNVRSHGMVASEDEGIGTCKAERESHRKSAIHADEHDLIKTERSRIENEVAGDEDG